MKTRYLLFVISSLLFSVALTSCSDDDYLGGHATTDGAGTLMNVTAQINAQSDPTLAWNENDVIGVATGYGQSDATARNRGYVCQADGRTFKQTTGYPIYVKGTTNIVAYYPFVGTEGAEPNLTLSTIDQQHVTDYLFAKAENVTPQNGGHVNLVFDYALARLTMAVSAPAGEEIHTCRLTGFAQQATVDPYSLEMTLNAPEDLVLTSVTPMQSISLKLIPQQADAESGIVPRLILVGNIRSYSIDLSELVLNGGNHVQANVDVTDGVGSVEFVPGGSAWNNSGIGGDVNSN